MSALRPGQQHQSDFAQDATVVLARSDTDGLITYQQVPQQYRNGDLADRRYVYRSLLFDFGREITFAGKVDAHSSIPHLLQRDLVLVAGYATNDYVAERQAVVQGPARLVDDFVSTLSEADSSCEFLNVADIDAKHAGAVVR